MHKCMEEVESALEVVETNNSKVVEVMTMVVVVTYSCMEVVMEMEEGEIFLEGEEMYNGMVEGGTSLGEVGICNGMVEGETSLVEEERSSGMEEGETS